MWLQGRPIYVQHLGAINYKKMQEVTTDERMIKFHVQEYERCARVIMPACSIVAGRHIDQTFAIIDVKGAPRPLHICNCFKAVFAGRPVFIFQCATWMDTLLAQSQLGCGLSTPSERMYGGKIFRPPRMQKADGQTPTL